MKTQNKAFKDVPVLGTKMILVNEGSSSYDEVQSFHSPRDVVVTASPFFEGSTVEMMYVFMLNAANKIIGIHKASSGGISSAIVEPRLIYKCAILMNATSIIAVHNHPSGDPTPSKEDVFVTEQLVEAGRFLAIPLRDHIIIAGDSFTSLSEKGLL